MVLLYSLPPPWNSQAIVIPFIVSFLSTPPFNIIFFYRLIHEKYYKKKKPIEDLPIKEFRVSEVETSDNISQSAKLDLPILVSSSSSDSAAVQ
ncbi:unnamed protein product [Rotaria socialis]|nr:unnamed protein product [Rotaria socialis]CAF3344226.1 unnamed protein product [Rotaria socialis]CAF3612740.1 unnamed protein product [Rotaria socialis]CAF3785728.1 unnamed protein product [Rotaria socialis]